MLMLDLFPNDTGGMVFVNAYSRVRFGKTEWVAAHFRKWPRS